MSASLIQHLVETIEYDTWSYRGREYDIMITCWDFFSGGDTATTVAHHIETALHECSHDQRHYC